MKIKQSSLAASAVHKQQYPERQLPEIVLLGRSNVGKSSLINCLLNRKNLARVSASPGKTRLLNFYLVESEIANNQYDFYFVDLPGYGYAKVSQSERSRWLEMIEEFLSSRVDDKFCWQVVDIRHQPSELDLVMHRILVDAGYQILLVANKADKISRGARSRQLKLIGEALQVNPAEIIAFSSESGEGKQQLVTIIKDHLI